MLLDEFEAADGVTVRVEQVEQDAIVLSIEGRSGTEPTVDALSGRVSSIHDVYAEFAPERAMHRTRVQKSARPPAARSERAAPNTAPIARSEHAESSSTFPACSAGPRSIDSEMAAYAPPTLTAALLLAAQLIAPRAAAGAEVEQHGEPLIYGADSRVEARAHPDAALRELSRSVVALVQRSAIHVGEEGVEVVAPRLAETIDFCDEERFLEQPVLADCSGVLVGADLVLTAGHCVGSAEQCRELYVVRDYALDAAGSLELEREGIHRCAELVAREVSNVALPEVLDYALVRIEPPVEGVRPVPVRNTRLSQGDPVVLVGHGLGLPTKIDDVARVVDPRNDVRDYFGAQFDLFHRGSGSGVFDTAGHLAGIAVRGGTDFDGEETCASLRRVPMESSAMEEATYASAALERSGLAWPASEQIFAEEQALPEAACSFTPGRRAAGAWLPMVGLLAVVLRRRRPFDPTESTQSMRKP